MIELWWSALNMYNIYGVGSDIERGRFNEINDCIGNMFLTFLTGSLIDHPINDLVCPS